MAGQDPMERDMRALSMESAKVTHEQAATPRDLEWIHSGAATGGLHLRQGKKRVVQGSTTPRNGTKTGLQEVKLSDIIQSIEGFECKMMRGQYYFKVCAN